MGSSASAAVTVEDDDDPTVTISAGPAVTEGTAASFTIIRAGDITAALVVQVSVTDSGSFLDGTAPTSVTIAADAESATLSVATDDDDADEPHGTITASLAVDDAYAIDASAATAAVSVRDNEIVACERGTAVPDPDAKPGLVADCKLLLAAKDTLRGTASLNWSGDRAISRWTGITVAGQRVTKILLSRKRLTGTIPPELGGLSRLTHLQLGDNSLTGAIPPELGNLSQLWLLSLVGNNLTGEIPAELGKLTRLARLTMHQNDLTGEIPWQLGNLGQLNLLYLDDGHSGCLPREWQSLTFLANNLDGLGLPTCPTPPPCANETTIPDYATKPDLVDDCGVLLDIKDALRGTARLNWDVSRALTTWDGITVAGTPPRVTILALPSRRLTGSLPPRLGRLDGLTNLSLEWNRLRGAIPAELRRLTELRYLSLYRNRLSGSVPAFLGGLTELRTLTLSDNYLAGAIPAELGNLPHLQGLFLYNNRLTGAIPPELGDLSDLTDVFLSGNTLTGCLPRELAQVERSDLAQLSLGPCPLRSKTLTYGAPTTTGSVTDAGDYAFLTDPDDLTTMVTTYEGLRDGSTTGLVIHQSDSDGTSQAALYDLVQAGDLMEWRQAADCFVRYTVTGVKDDPDGDPPRKLLAVAWMTYAFTGCSGALSPTTPAILQWGPLPALGGTSLTAPVIHGIYQLVPADWTGAAETGRVHRPPGIPPGPFMGTPGTETRDLTEARAHPYWREPTLPTGWGVPNRGHRGLRRDPDRLLRGLRVRWVHLDRDLWGPRRRPALPRGVELDREQKGSQRPAPGGRRDARDRRPPGAGPVQSAGTESFQHDAYQNLDL